LTAELREQLLAVPPSTDPVASDLLLEYRPCVVSLRDGSSRDYVYVQDVEPWYAAWGVLPEEDSDIDEVFLGDVVSIRESPRRLPIPIANRLYAWGETGMGYYVFTVVVDDGREIPCGTGNAV